MKTPQSSSLHCNFWKLHTYLGDYLTSPGNLLTSLGDELTFVGNELTFLGNHLTFVGNELTFVGDHLTFAGNLWYSLDTSFEYLEMNLHSLEIDPQ